MAAEPSLGKSALPLAVESLHHSRCEVLDRRPHSSPLHNAEFAKAYNTGTARKRVTLYCARCMLSDDS
jgi:hypothetical protein